MALALRTDLANTPQLCAFRDELRDWLAVHLTDEFRVFGLRDPTGAGDAEFELRRAWQRQLYSGGWAGVHWPAEHGGRSASLIEYAIYIIECANAGAPDPANAIGMNMIGPTLIAHGTTDQQKHLEGILSGEQIWSQLFSEPDAGSDLGTVATRATRVGGGWSVQGHKVWISWGLLADYGLLLARSDPTSHGFKGLSCFILPLRGPGVTVRGLRQMSGETHFAEIFLDDVALPEDALVGPENQGWQVAATTLVHERTTAILSRHGTTAVAAEHLLQLALAPGVDVSTRNRCIAAWSESQIFRLTGYRGVIAAAHGYTLNSPAATQRLQWGLLNRRIFELGLELLGPFGMLDTTPWTRLACNSRGWSIGGGTAEIQRNMLSERVLGLPRELDARPGRRQNA